MLVQMSLLVNVYVPLICCILSGWLTPFPDHITIATTGELPVPVGRLSCVSVDGIVLYAMLIKLVFKLALC